MLLVKDVNLRPYNTFGISASASYFTEARTLREVKNSVLYARSKNQGVKILGGGSNVLLTQNSDCVVIHPTFNAVTIIDETEEGVTIQVEAGMNWHQFVILTLSKGWYGLENLSLIPGCVGAAPIQNIGAYGVEVKSFISQVNFTDLNTLEDLKYNNSACEFSYRNSVFKGKLKGKVFISSVVFELHKEPRINSSYGAIQSELDLKGIKNPGPKDISDAVIRIRQSKLPDPRVIGNAGSFFKNPVVTAVKAGKLLEAYPNMAQYHLDNGEVKLAAGWMIEECGWKGKSIGNCGVHSKQALVLVNKGGAAGHEVLKLSRNIIETVMDKFGVRLEPEVNIW